MRYISTRGNGGTYTAAQAILTGIAPDGGLFVPETIPSISWEELERMKDMPFYELSATVLAKFLDGFDFDELIGYTRAAYSEDKWGEDPVPLVQLNAYNDRVTAAHISLTDGGKPLLAICDFM